MPDLSMPRLMAACESDVGRLREHNEDAYYLDEEHGLFVVSDGMGGAKAGEVASQMVVDLLPTMVTGRLENAEKLQSWAVRYWLRQDLHVISRQIYVASINDPDLVGMGATVVAALVLGHQLYIAHMGDSRAYTFRQDHLKQITEDHSIVNILMRNGEISAQEAREHPDKSLITRHMGMAEDTYPAVRTLNLRPGDQILLCTDGLTDMLSDNVIASILRTATNPYQATESLVEVANEAGGRDNITALLIRWDGLTPDQD